MNQLQLLIDGCLTETKHVESAAILNIKSVNVAAASTGFNNGHGLILVKTALYIIVATYNENMYPSVCVEAVEKLADYLREKGK